MAVTGAAFSELARTAPVVRSLEVLGYPLYLTPWLGVAKLLAVAALVFPRWRWVTEWAYAGLSFDFVGATLSFLAAGRVLLPDVVLAPTYLALTVTSLMARRSRWRRDGDGAHDPLVVAPSRS